MHNPHTYAWGQHAVDPFEWSVEREAQGSLQTGEHRRLIQFETMGREAQLSIPTPDQYLPLLYVIATRAESDPPGFPVEGVDGGSISMLAVQLG